MFSFHIREDKGLLLVRNKVSRIDSAIHMLFVFTDLAVIWINNDLQVVDKVLARPWRLMYYPNCPARYILEINPSFFSDFNIGDQLAFK